jgi:hypothetical protein
MTVLIVKKRGNSRFFLRQRDQLGNPPVGTVIDNTITKSEG